MPQGVTDLSVVSTFDGQANSRFFAEPSAIRRRVTPLLMHPKTRFCLQAWAWALATVALTTATLSAQEVRQPRAPMLEARSSPTPTALQLLPTDSLPSFDPSLDIVRPFRPLVAPEGFRTPYVSGLDVFTYIRESQARARDRLWSASVVRRLAGRDAEGQGLIPQLENPLRVPAPLARVFGQGSEFDIEGRLHLASVGSRSKQNPDLRPQLLRQAIGTFDLDIDQILDLKVLGSVGTKLDMLVDFNSSRELDSKQLITATYTGAEDEILQKVEVGDIRVTMPPSRFLAGGLARGTFGAQALAQLGPVDLRVMGSKKEGQSTDRSLRIAPRGEGVLQEVTLDIKDTQFQDDRFYLFFHPDSLASGRIAFPNQGTTLADPNSAPAEGTLALWLDDGNFNNNRERASKRGTAVVNPTDPATRPEESREGFFDLLVEGQDYVVTDQLIVQLKRQLSENEMLAATYTTVGGTRVGSLSSADTLLLKLIRPPNPDTLDFTWDYTLRNVYSLREPDIQLSSLGLEVYRGNRDLKQTIETIGAATRKYTEIFGLTDEAGRVAVPRILRDPFGGPDYLVFPDVRPFFEPTEPNGEPIPLERPNRKLYFNSDTRVTALNDQVYFIGATYLSRGGVSGEVELGAANVIEGSEDISIGGQTLIRGQDYQIFYDFGRVVFNDPAGLAERYPNESIAITFEVAPLFNLAPTILWGATGTWQAATDLVLNSTVLVQRQQSLANRPILGAEPTQTLIAEVDGSFVRSLPWLSRWLDNVPGLDTDQSSSIALRGELAWSQPDPNTQGQVFLNDFENIEVAKRLSMQFRTWALSSIPQEAGLSVIDYGQAKWYTFAATLSEITPGVRGVDLGADKFIMRFEPRGASPAELQRSWRSIHTVLSSTGDDMSRQEFVEFFVRSERGTIIVDLGTVNEDQVRADEDGQLVGVLQLDTEESDPASRDNNLDVSEDTGIDAVRGSDFEEVPGDDGNDDFDEFFGPDRFPLNPNGTENNTVLDTEDDDLDGILDAGDDVLRWVIDLENTPYEVPGSRNSFGFRQIRLPLKSPEATVGSPDLRNVRAMRLTFTGVEVTTEFEMALLEIVGSTWLERGVVAEDGTPIAGQESDSLRISAINDVENPEYESPPGVRAQQDRADEIAGVDAIVREQSLELSYEGLPPGARGAIYRPLFDRESYIDYSTMPVWVQGRGTEGAVQPNFFVDFGIDTLNVYEYSAPLPDHDWEEHVIDLAVFTELKRGLVDSLATVGGTTGERVSADGRYRVRIGTGDSPAPTLTEVSQLTIGVDNTTAGTLSGSFWIDEWRLTSPVRIGGAAGYVNARARVADFAELAMSYETRGARYRDIGAMRNNFDSGNLDWSALFRLERFMPQSWGLSMPLTITHYDRRDEPLYRIGSDVEVRGEDEISRMTRSNSQNVVTLRAYRTRQSSNQFLAATLDRLEARVIWRSDAFGSLDLDTDRGRWDTWVGYRHGFRPRAFPLGLGWLARVPWPGVIKRSDALQRLATADFNVAPANVALTAESAFEDRTVRKELDGRVDTTADSTRQLQGNAQVAFQPFQSMRATFGWDTVRDLNFPDTVVEGGALGVDALRVQSFNVSWSPPVAKWLTPRYTYASNFNRNHTREASRSLDSLDLRDAAVTTTSSLTLDLTPAALALALGAAEGSSPWWSRVLSPIRFDRNTQESVSFVQIDEDPGFGFAFGFGDLSDAVEADPQNQSSSDAWGVSTGLGLIRGLDLRTTYREQQTERRYFQGATATESRIWPNVTMRYTGPRLPGLLGRWLSSWTLSSDFERRTSANLANGEPLDDSDRRVWDPLASLTLQWANGLTTDIRANASNGESSLIRGGVLDSRREDKSRDLLVNVNYLLRPGSKIYVPFPTLWGATLKNPLRTTLTFARRGREDATTLAGDPSGAGALNLKTISTEVRPSVSYEFGRVVTGFGLSYLSREDQKRDITYTTYSAEMYLDFLF